MGNQEFVLLVVRWPLSIILLMLGVFLSVGNALTLVGLAVRGLKSDAGSVSLVLPCFGGVSLFLGVLTLPVNLPWNRLISALLVIPLDITIPIIVQWFVVERWKRWTNRSGQTGSSGIEQESQESSGA